MRKGAKAVQRLWPTGLAGRHLELSGERLRQLCDAGRIQFDTDMSGRRLIPESEIRRLFRERQEATAKR